MQNRTRETRNGFTLVELLVVVTIIVILLALLVPAMDKAIYEAELAVCAAHQKAIGQTGAIYAVDHKRSYPYREGVHNPNSNWQVTALALPLPPPLGPHDDRSLLSQYMSINGLLNDPLAAPVNLETTADESWVLGNVGMWFGYGFVGHAGMFRLGDRWEWGGRKFDILVADRDVVANPDGAQVQSSHPDKNGVTSNYVLQDGENPWLGESQGAAVLGIATSQATKLTISHWLTFETSLRGPLDNNFTYQDLSVKRYNGVEWNSGKPGLGGDRRMVSVPQQNSGKGIPQYVPAN